MPLSPTTYRGTEVDGKIVVGVADLALCDDPSATIVTYALGSCIGVCIYDPVAHVGGLLHFMLPESKINAEKAAQSPAIFADTGVPLLFKGAYELGARKERLTIVAAGGAEVLADDGHFKVGSRNRTMLRKLFWKNNILLSADDTGGSISRTMMLKMADGEVTVRSKGKERRLWPV
ncbi:MAG: chemotaxis protein CheD [Phycisphaerales bacterium]